jgi:hypothetical protein
MEKQIMARQRKEPRHIRKKKLSLRIEEINKELDVVLNTGIPQKYMRLVKEKSRKETKLRWMQMWDGR